MEQVRMPISELEAFLTENKILIKDSPPYVVAIYL